GPAAVLHAKDVERKRWRTYGHDAVLADNAVLLAAADKFAGQQYERALAPVDEHELVHGGARRLRNIDRTAVTPADHFLGAAFADHHFACCKAFLQRQKGAGVLAVRGHDGKHGNVFIGNRIEDSPIAFRL